MKKQYAVVDLETTGPNPQLDKIIQIGIVLIDEGQIVDSFSQDINPERKLPLHIVDLTQITDEQLKSAPLFEEVAQLLFSLIQGRTFIAHNVNFDYQFLKYHFWENGIEFQEKGIDTVELTQILYPSLESYRLEDITKVFNLTHQVTHQADSDAIATAELYLKLVQRSQKLPKYLLGQLAELATQLSYQTSDFFREAFFQSEKSKHPYVEINGILLKPLEKRIKPTALNKATLNQVIEDLGLEKRPIQNEMIAYLSEAKNKPNFVEAPSGIGKTFAYLFGCVDRLKQNQRLVVSTETKLLQNQLISEEIPKIERVFNIQSVVLKSKRNYLDLSAFLENIRTVKGKRTAIYQMGVLVWLLSTETGDLDELNNLDLSHHFFENVKYGGQIANRFGDYDFYQRIIKKLETARVIITNHAYLLECLNNPRFDFTDDILVIDEAHQWIKTIEQFQEQRIDLFQLLKNVEQEAFEKDNELQHRIVDILRNTINQLRLIDTVYLDDEWFSLNIILVESLLIYLNDLLTVGTEYEEEIITVIKYFENHDKKIVKWLVGKNPLILAENRLDVSATNQQLSIFSEQIFVSATLSFNQTTDFFPKLLGIEDYAFKKFNSTIFQNQQLWIDKDGPDILNLSQKEYSHYICEVIETLVKLKRPILVLFTSNELLKLAYYHLDSKIETPIFAQGITGSNARILKRFRYADEAILFATSSFWEGVDFPEFNQSILIITRLPFEQPEDPFVKRMTVIQERLFKNVFKDYTLPLATLKLRQAFGRNLRHQKQQSAIVMLDKRLVTKGYGKAIINNLPADLTINQEKFRKIPLMITDFFNNQW